MRQSQSVQQNTLVGGTGPKKSVDKGSGEDFKRAQKAISEIARLQGQDGGQLGKIREAISNVNEKPQRQNLEKQKLGK